MVPKILNWQLQTKTIQRKVKKAKESCLKWLEIPFYISNATENLI